MLVMKGRVYVPNVDDLRKAIMEEAHCSAYAMHLDSTKMYRTIKENYWWSGMKRDNKICVKVFCVPTGECRTSKTCRNSSIYAYTGMEVGTHHHGLRCWFASHLDRP